MRTSPATPIVTDPSTPAPPATTPTSTGMPGARRLARTGSMRHPVTGRASSDLRARRSG